MNTTVTFQDYFRLVITLLKDGELSIDQACTQADQYFPVIQTHWNRLASSVKAA